MPWILNNSVKTYQKLHFFGALTIASRKYAHISFATCLSI